MSFGKNLVGSTSHLHRHTNIEYGSSLTIMSGLSSGPNKCATLARPIPTGLIGTRKPYDWLDWDEEALRLEPTMQAKETVNVELESFDLETNNWTKEKSIIHFEKRPFAAGGMRNAHKAWNCKRTNWENHPMVLKMPIEPQLQTESLVRTQVVMQARCVRYAEQFNEEPSTPKKITYVPCILVKFLSGQWTGYYGCLEKLLEGNFVKHNTVDPHYDGVAFTNRNTPQAFSHYTFEKSDKTEIVVDVQGVGDTYTDPQLYSVILDGDMPPYGPADWSIFGVANFFRQHQCNSICLALGLSPNRVKHENSQTTVPATFF